MGNVIGIPTTRVSDLFVRQRLLSQIQADQLELFQTQMQLSTGQRFHVPSEDPDAALRVMRLQRLLERKEQIRTNLNTNETFLTATDTALGTVSNSLAEVRGVALGVLDTVATDTQRAAASQQVQQVMQQLMEIGNHKFRGRYLFAGTGTTVCPFEETDQGLIQYAGDEGRLASYSDIQQLFDSNLNGVEVFGAVSDPVRGTEDLKPVLTYHTRLADLHGGRGITPGSISLISGGETSVIDISSAETIGDVAAMIRANPPQGTVLDVEVTSTGLRIQLDPPGGLLAIREVGGRPTAEELGILTETATAAPIIGDDLDPILRLTTRVNDILGVRSRALVSCDGTDNDLIFEADTPGTAFDGIHVVFLDDGSVITPGVDETATYDPATTTLTVTMRTNGTRARHVVEAVNAAYASGSVPLSARINPLDDLDGGEGIMDVTATGTTAGGSGVPFDVDSGLQIVNGGQTHVLDFSDAVTIEDVLNVLNMSDAGVLAEINENATGINIRSRVSGADFMIGENGGSTATQLGLRTFTEETRLEDLNFGRGVEAPAGTDFVITLADGTQLDVNVSGAETVGDVLTLINNLGVPTLQARTAVYGNGIELVDTTPGSGTLTVTKTVLSRAAIDLGLIPEDAQAGTPQSPGTFAEATVVSAGANNDLIFSAADPGNQLNDVTIVFQDTGAEAVSFDPVAGTLTFDIIGGTTTANDVIALLAGDPVAGALFSAALDPTDGSPNDGTGPVDDGATATMTGGSQTLTGADTNTLETEGILTAVLRLRAALDNNDVLDAQRAIEMLDEQLIEFNFSRAELGARQQGLDLVQLRLETEDIDLREILSLEFDTDIVEAVSTLTARQLAFEAGLKATAQTFSMTLLDYL